MKRLGFVFVTAIFGLGVLTACQQEAPKPPAAPAATEQPAPAPTETAPAAPAGQEAPAPAAPAEPAPAGK
jgi:hypothetical protein